MKILGIDPGLQCCGYAVVDVGREREKLLEAGVLKTKASMPIEFRLNQLSNDMRSLLKRFKPNVIAVETLYSHYAHPETAILMAHARGVILQTAAMEKIQIQSFSATRIKKAVTGSGRAGKAQIQRAVQSLLNLPRLPEPPDVADAIAAALCCVNNITTEQQENDSPD